jgi:hypothetical protein
MPSLPSIWQNTVFDVKNKSKLMIRVTQVGEIWKDAWKVDLKVGENNLPGRHISVSHDRSIP